MSDEFRLNGEHLAGESHIPLYHDDKLVGYVIVSFAQVIHTNTYAAAAMFMESDNVSA